MGRAIVRRPKVFLFDEPLSNLDASLRAQVRVELARLHRQLGVTMVYVTHDQVEAMTLADRIAVLHEGVLQQVGAPAELYDRPANRFVASFIGSPTMNFLDATLEGRGDGLVACGDGFELAVERERIAGTESSPAQGRRVSLGIRPHDLRLAADGGDGTQGLGVEVDVIEPMGWEALLYATLGRTTLVAHGEAGPISGLRLGERVRLTVSRERLHLFDRDTGRSLAWP
jgi:ABC-type sugar transport system ATPase subunit